MNVLVILIGGSLAGVTFFSFRKAGAERLRRLMALALGFAAFLYLTFAVYGYYTGSADARSIAIEFAGLRGFSVIAVLGMRLGAYLMAFGWAAHILWDVGLNLGGTVSFAPYLYAELCIGFDLAIAACIAYYFYFKNQG